MFASRFIPHSGAIAEDSRGSPDADWVKRSRERGLFLAHVHEEAGTPAFPDIVKSLQALSPQGVTSALLGFRMQRQLGSGHLFPITAELSYESSGGGALVRLVATRPNDTQIQVRMRLRRGIVASIELENLPRSSGDKQMVQVLPRDILETAPVAIGDLDVRDLLIFMRTLEKGDWDRCGLIKGLGSRTQVVFQILAPRDDAIDPARAAAPLREPPRMARALVYVEPDPIRITLIHVFDDDERLIRTYQDFIYDFEVRPPLLTFRASSIPSDSSTSYHIRSFSWEST